MKDLEERAKKRMTNYSAIKGDKDVKIENENANELLGYVNNLNFIDEFFDEAERNVGE